MSVTWAVITEKQWEIDITLSPIILSPTHFCTDCFLQGITAKIFFSLVQKQEQTSSNQGMACFGHQENKHP